MKINYRHFESSDEDIISELIERLYKEDESIKQMTGLKIRKTFYTLREYPERGSILVIEKDSEIAGYSILINYWSNEFGGNILFIDELYIKEEFRNQGIGTSFIKYLKKSRFCDAVALQLEVTPDNIKARKLYESLGFILHKNETLTCEI